MMEGGIATYLFTQGVLGIVVLAEAYVIVKLYNRNTQQEQEKFAIMESRRLDDKQTIKDVSDVVAGNTQANLILAEKIKAGKTAQRRKT